MTITSFKFWLCCVTWDKLPSLHLNFLIQEGNDFDLSQQSRMVESSAIKLIKFWFPSFLPLIILVLLFCKLGDCSD